MCNGTTSYLLSEMKVIHRTGLIEIWKLVIFIHRERNIGGIYKCLQYYKTSIYFSKWKLFIGKLWYKSQSESYSSKENKI